MRYTNQEKPIEELVINAKCKSSEEYKKQMKIVEAVNALKGKAASTWATTVWIHSFGGYLFGCNSTDQTVCTIEEYNNCIEEMKYHYDIPKWCSYNRANKELLTVGNSDQSFYEKEKFVYGQDVYIKDTHFSNELIKFGCLTIDGNGAILLTENGYMLYPIAGVSSKPIKSKEDIELEEAKKKQVHDNAFIYSHYFKSIDGAREVFLYMQKDGKLAEVKLTEEE